MLIPESLTQQTLRLCSIHYMIEVLPGIWKPDKFFTRFHSNNYEIEEAECPTCLQIAQDTFKKQFPMLYTTPTPLFSRRSA